MNWKSVMWLVLAAAAVVLVLDPDTAFAAQSGSLPYETGLGKFVKSLTGPVVFSLSVIAIVVAGATIIFGGADLGGWARSMAITGLAVGVMLGAPNIVSTFFGAGATISEVRPLTDLVTMLAAR